MWLQIIVNDDFQLLPVTDMKMKGKEWNRTERKGEQHQRRSEVDKVK